MTMRTDFWAALGCGIMLAALPACRKNEEHWTATPKTAVGHHYKVTLESVKECDVKWDHLQAPPSNITLGVEVILEGTTDAQVSIDSYHLEIKDPQGNSYKPIFIGGCQPELVTWRKIAKNEKSRGWFTLHVPEQVSALKVIYRPREQGDEGVRFALNR